MQFLFLPFRQPREGEQDGSLTSELHQVETHLGSRAVFEQREFVSAMVDVRVDLADRDSGVEGVGGFEVRASGR